MAAFRDRWGRLWYGGNGAAGERLFRAISAPLAAAYGAAVAVRNGLYRRGVLRQERLPCPVISIGNLVVGGAGKTPMTLWIAGMLRQEGFRPAILSRGYGGKARQAVRVVSDGTKICMDVALAGDEPFLLARACPGVPVLTGRSRAEAGRLARASFGADVFLLDDGFQHRRLARDLDIVLLDAAAPFGNGRLLPAGPLRETPGALGRAHAIVLTRADSGPFPVRAWLAQRFPDTPVFQARHTPVCLRDPAGTSLDPSFLAGKKTYAFAGIARPETFRQTLETLGAAVIGFRAFPDHHPYTEEDLRTIQGEATAGQAACLVTTAKDAVRLERTRAIPRDLRVLEIAMSPAGDDGLSAWLRRQLASPDLSAEGRGRG